MRDWGALIAFAILLALVVIAFILFDPHATASPVRPAAWDNDEYYKADCWVGDIPGTTITNDEWTGDILVTHETCVPTLTKA